MINAINKNNNNNNTSHLRSSINKQSSMPKNNISYLKDNNSYKK